MALLDALYGWQALDEMAPEKWSKGQSMVANAPNSLGSALEVQEEGLSPNGCVRH